MDWGHLEPTSVQVAAVAQVQNAADDLNRSQAALAVAMRKAWYDADVSLRKIAEAAGVSHEQVRRMISANQT